MRQAFRFQFACFPVLPFAVLAASAAFAVATPARADASDLAPEIGFNYGEIETPRIAAMGGAMRAMSNSL